MGEVKYPNYYLYPPEEFEPLAEFDEEKEKEEMGETDRDMLERLLRAADSMLLACAGTNNEVYRKAVNVLDMTVSNIKRILGNNPKLPVDTVVKEAVGDPAAMEKSIVNYTLISCYDLDELELKVKENMTCGWTPFGSPAAAFINEGNEHIRIQYTQAMVLYV